MDLGVRAQCSKFNHGVVAGARSPVYGRDTAVALTGPWTAMMRQYRVENGDDARTPCIEFVGLQGLHGAIPQTYVRSFAEQRCERCDVSNVSCAWIDARLEAYVDFATVVKVNQKCEPIAALIIELFNACQARQS